MQGDSPWIRNLLVASDPFSGYGSWTLPRLRGAIASGDEERIRQEFEGLRERVSEWGRLQQGWPTSITVDPIADFDTSDFLSPLKAVDKLIERERDH